MPPRIAIRAELLCQSRRTFSTSIRRLDAVELAYTRHDPPQPSSKPGPPILLMHGLFGSQRNNRTMSKYAVALPLPLVLTDASAES